MIFQNIAQNNKYKYRQNKSAFIKNKLKESENGDFIFYYDDDSRTWANVQNYKDYQNKINEEYSKIKPETFLALFELYKLGFTNYAINNINDEIFIRKMFYQILNKKIEESIKRGQQTNSAKSDILTKKNTKRLSYNTCADLNNLIDMANEFTTFRPSDFIIPHTKKYEESPYSYPIPEQKTQEVKEKYYTLTRRGEIVVKTKNEEEYLEKIGQMFAQDIIDAVNNRSAI